MTLIDPYTIRDVAERVGSSVDTLRYYESAGLMIEVPRKRNGHREYNEDHIRWLTFIGRLRDAGMPIGKVREHARMTREGEHTLPARVEILEEHRCALAEKSRQLAEHLKRVEAKLQIYRDKGFGCDKRWAYSCRSAAPGSKR